MKYIAPYQLTRGTPHSAGYDLRTTKDYDLESGKVTKVSTGLYLELEEGTYGQVHSRSSLASKGIITVGGVIDCDYRGEVIVCLLNLSGETYVIKDGDRIAQLVHLPIVITGEKSTKELEPSERGSGGFGSTGIN